MKIYAVTFDVQIPGRTNKMIFHCMANNAAEAKAAARDNWSRLYLGSHKGRARNLYAKRSDVQDVSALRVTGWEGTTYRADYVMGRPFCTGSVNTWKRRK